jgi:hypothetical protein
MFGDLPNSKSLRVCDVNLSFLPLERRECHQIQRLKQIRYVIWKSYETNVLPCQRSHYILANVRRTVIAEENTGEIFEMHRFARRIEIVENNIFDIFLENWVNHVRRVVGTDKKVLPIPPSIFPNGIIYRLPVNHSERDQHITRH